MIKISPLKLSFTIAILGIFTILILTNILQPKLTTINQLTTKQLNKQIKIQGTITNIKNNPTSQILTIQDSTQTIQTILNNPQTTLKINQTIIITGTLQQYQDQLQIQTNKILATQPKP